MYGRDPSSSTSSVKALYKPKGVSGRTLKYILISSVFTAGGARKIFKINSRAVNGFNTNRDMTGPR